MVESCWCDSPATQFVDSDSFFYQDHGQPVCETHAEGRDPVEDNIFTRSKKW